MSFEYSSITWGAKQLSAMVKNNRIQFGNIVQRSYVWEKSRRSLFIHSLCSGFPIPATYAKRFENDSADDEKKAKKTKKDMVYDMLDGRQRLTTIAQFINGELVLTEDTPSVTFMNELTDQEETEKLAGKSFFDLSEGLQEKVKNARVSVIYFDNLTVDEERELFKRLNNGKPLTAKNKMLANCKNLEEILEIGKHAMFMEMLSEKAKESKAQVTYVMKAWCMMYESINDISFDSKYFHPLVENTVISAEEREEMDKVFDLMMNAHTILVEKDKKTARKMYKESNWASLVRFFKIAIENGFDENQMADWIFDFFYTDDKKVSISDQYNEASASGTGKSMNIIARNEALGKSFAEWFSEDHESVRENDVPKIEMKDETIEEAAEKDGGVVGDGSELPMVPAVVSGDEFEDIDEDDIPF